MDVTLAGNAIDVLAIGMLIAAVAVVGTRSLGFSFLALAAQSIMLAAAGICAGLAEDWRTCWPAPA